MSVVGTDSDFETPLREIGRACADRLHGILTRCHQKRPRDCLQLFVASHWERPGAVMRKRGLWGKEELSWLSASAPRSAVVEVQEADTSRVRLAGLAQIELAALDDSIEFIRTHGNSLLIWTAQTEWAEDRVRELFSIAFPKAESRVDWGSVVETLLASEQMCIRAFGEFDDREVSVDVFLSWQSNPIRDCIFSPT